MVWFDNISQLQYYNQAPGDPCYCELLISPSDLLLQGILPYTAFIDSSVQLHIYAYSVDGLTNYGEVTSSFEYYFSTNPNGYKYFNARLKTFPNLLCANPCFILNVQVTNTGLYFNKWTERYCMDSCCTRVKGIVVAQDGVPLGNRPAPATGSYQDVLVMLPPPTPFSSIPEPKYDSCGRPVITLRVVFSCFDKFTGEYYGDPGAIIAGSGSTAFNFQRITNFKGTIEDQPREIERTVSVNCVTQKTTTVRKYDVQSFEQFPPWKKDEIEGMLLANHIYIEDQDNKEREYIFRTGTPFEKIYRCKRFYKLRLTVEDCPQYQIFGCSEPCNQRQSYFLLPENGGLYYDESRRLIGTSFADLLGYYRAQDGTQEVEEVAVPSGLAAYAYKIFRVDSFGYVPTYFYAGLPYPSNKVFGQKLDAGSPDLASLTNGRADAATTPKPVLAAATVTTMDCPAPELGDATVSDATTEYGTVSSYGPWEVFGETSVVSSGAGVVTFAITSSNSDYPDQIIVLNGQTVGVLPVFARPTISRTIRHEDNANVPEGGAVVVNPSGTIQWYGETTSSSDTATTVHATFISFNL